jgi:parvulin-like peptidyl-prolyl isomerase
MSHPVAVVNGRPITRADLENAIQGFAMEMHRKTMEHLSAEERSAIRELALEKLLGRELIFQEALAQGVVADEAAVAGEKQRIMANFPSEEEFSATLERAGIEPAVYHRMIRQDLTVNRMTEEKVKDLAEPSEADVAEFYHRHPEKMKEPARVRACHILVPVKDGDRDGAMRRMAEIRARLAAGEEFAGLAMECSACPSGARGGDLGTLRRGDLVRPFAEAVFAQPVGVVGEVVETPFGLHLIKVLERQEEAVLALEEAAPRIRRFLREAAAAALLKDWVAELRSRAAVQLAP